MTLSSKANCDCERWAVDKRVETEKKAKRVKCEISGTGNHRNAGTKRLGHPCWASFLPSINKPPDSEREREGHNNTQCETGKEGVAVSTYYYHNQLSLRHPSFVCVLVHKLLIHLCRRIRCRAESARECERVHL